MNIIAASRHYRYQHDTISHTPAADTKDIRASFRDAPHYAAYDTPDGRFARYYVKVTCRRRRAIEAILPHEREDISHIAAIISLLLPLILYITLPATSAIISMLLYATLLLLRLRSP